MQGQLTDEQYEVLRGVVQGQVVHDLGAGSCNLARVLLEMGARKVIAVDRRLPERVDPVVRGKGDGDLVRPELVRSYFHELDPLEHGVAFVSWPQQYVQGLTRLVEGLDTLVYLGCNTNYSACGPDSFWRHVRSRRLEHHVPHRRNTLLVYGGTLGAKGRNSVLEERAGLDRSEVYFYGDE